MHTVLPARQRADVSWLRRKPAVAITVLATVVGGSGLLATGSAGAASASHSRTALHSRAAARVAPAPPPSALMATGRTYGVTYALRTGSTAKSISLFVIGGSNAQTFVPAVYDVDSAGRPRSLVLVGPRVTVAAHAVGKVVSATLPAKHLRAGTYVLAIAAVTGRGNARALLKPAAGGCSRLHTAIVHAAGCPTDVRAAARGSTGCHAAVNAAGGPTCVHAPTAGSAGVHAAADQHVVRGRAASGCGASCPCRQLSDQHLERSALERAHHRRPDHRRSGLECHRD